MHALLAVCTAGFDCLLGASCSSQSSPCGPFPRELECAQHAITGHAVNTPSQTRLMAPSQTWLLGLPAGSVPHVWPALATGACAALCHVAQRMVCALCTAAQLGKLGIRLERCRWPDSLGASILACACGDLATTVDLPTVHPGWLPGGGSRQGTLAAVPSQARTALRL